MKPKTLNEGLRDEFKELLKHNDYNEQLKDLDKEILMKAFEAILKAKGKLEFSDNYLDDAKIALVQALRNNFI